MELELDGRAARGLRRYVRLVAEELGLEGDGQFVQFEAPVSAYVPVDVRLPRFPNQDVALIWDEEYGWAIGIETDAGTPIAVITYLGTEILPAPRLVANFLDEAVADTMPGQPDGPRLRHASARDDLATRLARYAAPVPPYRVPRPVGRASA